jgi:Protein of unknown function (DUF4058)
MRSPFPGMDPYLEAHWGDVHSRLVTYTCDALQARLPASLRARMQERVYIELPDEGRHESYPDVRVFEYPARRPGTGELMVEGNGGIAVADPVLVDLGLVSRTESYIEVVDVKSGHRVVTTIEVLSPSNKRPGEGQQLYLRKREDMKLGGVNTVEIDLLRAGERRLPIDPERVPVTHRTAYQVWTWRATHPNRVAIYGVPLRDRLPAIPIPLRPTDAEVVVDLQPILDQCYQNGGYDDINYRVPPAPPLEADDAAWADALLRERGLR